MRCDNKVLTCSNFIFILCHFVTASDMVMPKNVCSDHVLKQLTEYRSIFVNCYF